MDGKMGNWSLALRVRLLVGIASAAVLVLAIALLGWHAYQNGRDQLVLRTLGIARVSAANAVAAIEYADPHAARELLSSLGREPGILYAVSMIYLFTSDSLIVAMTCSASFGAIADIISV